MENKDIQLRLQSYHLHKDEKDTDFLVMTYTSDSGVLNVMYVPTTDIGKELESRKNGIYGQLVEIGKQKEILDLTVKELEDQLGQLSELEKQYQNEVSSIEKT